MRSFLVPISIFIALSTAHLLVSGAPLRVHVLSIVILALAFLVPSIWAAHLSQLKARLIVCATCALGAMLAWDATAHLVITKAEPFFILRGSSWLYVVGCLVLVAASFSASWLASPPNKAFKRTGFARRLT